MKACVRWIVAIALVFPVIAQAETHHVDDSGSLVLGRSLRLKPVAPFARGSQANVLSGDTTVAVRLNLAAWKGRQAKIYLTLPEQPQGTVIANWTTRGRLIPGVVRSGGRTVVYAGPVQSDLIEDTLRLSVQGDGRQLPDHQQLAFAFEIDLDSP